MVAVTASVTACVLQRSVRLDQCRLPIRRSMRRPQQMYQRPDARHEHGSSSLVTHGADLSTAYGMHLTCGTRRANL